MTTSFKFIHFEHVGKSKSGKTDVYECYNSDNGTLLGKVSYYAGWYKYVFEPNSELKLIFENQCLRDIASFTEELSKLQREKRKTGCRLVEQRKPFKEGDIVWVNPTDAKISKGKVVGFQVVGNFNPIVEGVTPDGVKFKNAFSLDSINHYREGKYFKEWRYV